MPKKMTGPKLDRAALKELRRIKRISQEQLARMMFVGRPKISLWETGALIPPEDEIIMMANVLNVPVEMLILKEE